MKRRCKLLILSLSFLFLAFTVNLVSPVYGEERITLERAQELARGSRTLLQSELIVEKAKYEYYQAQSNYDDAKTPSYYNLLPYYQHLQERKAQGEDVIAQLASVEKQISAAKEKLDSEADRAKSLRDTMENRETSYADSQVSQEKSAKQLDYQVEQTYTTILIQEDKLLSLNKELDYQYNLLNNERKKLTLGRSTQEKVDSLAIATSNLNKTIIEANNSLKILTGNFNDLLGRDYDAPLNLVPFAIREVAAIPVYNELLAVVTQNYAKLPQLEKSIAERKKDLSDDTVKDTPYQSDLINIEIKKQELDLIDEKNKLKGTISNLITDLSIQQKNYQLAKIDWANTQKNYERAQKRFQLGLISKLDLLQSELNYLAGRNKFQSTGYNFALAQHTLELAKEGILQ